MEENSEPILFTGEGRVIQVEQPDETRIWMYEYFLKDHLGNTRVAFLADSSDAVATQYKDYYPFGMEMTMYRPNWLQNSDNRFMYNGKELQDDGFEPDENGINKYQLDWYDYGARFYDPALGRWHVPDPAAENSFSKTPYNYCSNNPISRFDPNGRDDYYFNKGNWQIRRNENKYHTLTINGALQWRSDKLYVGPLERIHFENTVTFMMAPQNIGIYNDMLSRAKESGFEADVQVLYLEDLNMMRNTGSDNPLEGAYKLFQMIKKIIENKSDNEIEKEDEKQSSNNKKAEDNEQQKQNSSSNNSNSKNNNSQNEELNFNRQSDQFYSLDFLKWYCDDNEIYENR